MALRALIVIGSLALLGGAGWASWTGVGIVSADTGRAAVIAGRSVRSGSVGTGGVGRVRVK
ncbi:hypothetical protein MWU52_00295 [Jannaschia sp. S6380]|uniref:hypothetical protein n=1 Tax=Jannaschia sp. S6380 TaxID=2926408 RepID=UPI001FF1458C|nr:hypothetical protein [Jannaschia sp. S6380]MCK0165980.1 hypothetical protein [Jannaschia sp. S6380]